MLVKANIYRSIFKPMMGKILAVLAILLSLPFAILLLPYSLFITGGKPFFLQTRAGRKGKPFRMCKFRTISNGKIIGRYGRILRASSLDELPQVWNVLRGDMNWVGPRPLYMEYIAYYSDEHRRRLDVPPGITGLAQVSGRNKLEWSERLDLDVQYVDALSWRLDVMILLKTVRAVFKWESADSHETVAPFRGYDQ